MELEVLKTDAVRKYSLEVAVGIGRLMPYLDESFSGEPTPRPWLEEVIRSPYHEQLVTVRGSVEVVGAVCVGIQMGSGFGKRGQMEDFVVHPIARGRGIGRILLEAVDDWCISHELPFLLFETETHREAAIRLYERWGATRVTDGQDNKNGIVYRKDYELKREAA